LRANKWAVCNEESRATKWWWLEVFNIGKKGIGNEAIVNHA
jgi:hypothetical protein